jgi:hypothetical protein
MHPQSTHQEPPHRPNAQSPPKGRGRHLGQAAAEREPSAVLEEAH